MAGIPTDAKDSGTFAHILAKRKAVIAANPHARERILGRGELVMPRPPVVRRLVPIKPTKGNSPSERETFNRILVAVAKSYEIDLGCLLPPSRLRRHAWPRFACFVLIHQLLEWSLPVTGRAFKRDHTTILHGLRRAALLHETDEEWRAKYDAALAELKGGAS